MNESSDKDLADEQQLDQYLQGGSNVSQQYRQLHSAEVPAELDRLVLRQAEDAVKVRPAKSRTWMRWTAPLALAASAVLVVSIVIESGMRDEVMLTSERATAPVAPAPVQAKRKSEAAPSEPSRFEEVQGNAAEDVTAAPAEAPVLVVPLIEPSAMPAPEMVFEAEASIAQDVAAPAPPAQALSAESRDAAAPQAVARNAPPPAVLNEAAPDDELSQVVVTGSRSPEAEIAARVRRAGPRDSISPAQPSFSPPEAELKSPVPYTDPEAWLKDIRRLRAANKQVEADAEWQRFRQAFPNHPVTEEDAARGTRR